MSDTTSVMKVEEMSHGDGYKLTRLRLATMLEKYTNDKGRALDLLERWERGVWAGALLAAPDAASAKEAFGVAASAFLGDVDG